MNVLFSHNVRNILMLRNIIFNLSVTMLWFDYSLSFIIFILLVWYLSNRVILITLDFQSLMFILSKLMNHSRVLIKSCYFLPVLTLKNLVKRFVTWIVINKERVCFYKIKPASKRNKIRMVYVYQAPRCYLADYGRNRIIM